MATADCQASGLPGQRFARPAARRYISRPRHQAHAAMPHYRQIGLVNWIGLWTLYRKEVWRFLNVGMQTVMAPVVTTLLYYGIFALAIGGVVRTTGPFSYLEFMAPGLIMMAMTQNAFANTSSSVLIAKVQGNIVDVLMPPLSALELLVGYVGGGITRGLVVGIPTWLAIRLFVPIDPVDFGFVLFHAVAASMMLALLGTIGGIVAEKFDHLAALTNFVVIPLTFLSGTFYSIERLPEGLQFLAHIDPFFYMIDGFRYGFIGYADGSLATGIAVMIGGNAALALIVWRMLETGYRLKS
jgi:ABC-2 type transport system permease protein